MLVSVENLKKYYFTDIGIFSNDKKVHAVDDVTFDIKKGETLGLVGESGCGKSTLGSTVLRIEEPTSGKIFFEGKNILKYNRNEMKEFRRKAQIIFQDPSSSFDPRMTIGESIGEPLYVNNVPTDEIQKRVKKLLELVGMDPKDIDRYPHELSGGQKQRTAIARALSVNPKFLVADEPVSGLDMSIQAEILSLLDDIQEKFNLSVLFISHNIEVVRQISDRIAVMYMGEIVELAPKKELFENTQHPYTKALFSSIPKPDPKDEKDKIELSGNIPDPINPPSGCRFHTRCPQIIPPEKYNIKQKNWRSLINLKQYIEKKGIESIYEIYTIETSEKTEEIQKDKLEKIIKKEFNIQKIDDEQVTSIFEKFLDKTSRKQKQKAKDIIQKLNSICISEKPTPKTHGHISSCHLIETDNKKIDK